MSRCEVEDCPAAVSRPGHTLCHPHWIAHRDGELRQCQVCQRLKEDDRPLCRDCFEKKSRRVVEESSDLVTATELGRRIGLSAQRMNLLLAELGWINKELKGWSVTPHGVRVGGLDKESQAGTPYVVWPATIEKHRALRATIAELEGDRDDIPGLELEPASSPAAQASTTAFRERFPASHRAVDGHFVRSRAEMLIDNWLYQSGIVHAYERKLPLAEDDVYCDFYVPQGKVYIEYWGLEDSPDYARRKRKKQEIYKAAGFHLIELGDADIKNLDDVLPRHLLHFKVPVP